MDDLPSSIGRRAASCYFRALDGDGGTGKFRRSLRGRLVADPMASIPMCRVDSADPDPSSHGAGIAGPVHPTMTFTLP